MPHVPAPCLNLHTHAETGAFCGHSFDWYSYRGRLCPVPPAHPMAPVSSSYPFLSVIADASILLSNVTARPRLTFVTSLRRVSLVSLTATSSTARTSGTCSSTVPSPFLFFYHLWLIVRSPSWHGDNLSASGRGLCAGKSAQGLRKLYSGSFGFSFQ